MKVGDMVRLIQSKRRGGSWQPWVGEIGIVAALYEHPTSTWGEWFTILVNGKSRNIREDHLEVLHESR